MNSQSKKVLFLDAGDTLLFLRKSPGSLYIEAAREAGISIEDIDETFINQSFRKAWDYMNMYASKDYKDRYQNHPGGQNGFWIELMGRFYHYIGIEKIKEEVTKAVFRKFEDPHTWQLEVGFEKIIAHTQKKKIPLGIISNWDHRLSGILNCLKVFSQFTFMIVSSDFGYEKPSEKIFYHAQKLSGVSPECIFYCGDKPELDYYPAKKLGWNAFLYDKKGSNKEIQSVRNLEELIRFL